MNRQMVERDLKILLPSKEGMITLGDDMDDKHQKFIVQRLKEKYGKRCGILLAKAILVFRMDNPQYYTQTRRDLQDS